jgi:hypothetical protein
VSLSLAPLTAFEVMTHYEQRLAAGDWAGAWDMVSSEQRAAWKSLDAYTALESSFLKLYGTAFMIRPPATNIDEVRAAATDAGFTTVNPLISSLVTVDRVPVRDNTGWEMFIVGPEDGLPKIWQVR